MPANFKSQISNLKSNLRGILIIVTVIVIVGIGLAVYFVWLLQTTEEISQETPATAIAPLGEFEIENPQMTVPLEESEIPEAVIQLRITSAGFEPEEFTVKSGQPVSLTLTSLDKGTHILKFESPELGKIKIAVAGVTRGISFVAPEKGDYIFFCAVPGHRKAGEQGVMCVE